MNYINIGFKAVKFSILRKIRRPKILPINYTFFLTNKCNLRCKTCNIWKIEEKDNKTEEWEKIFRSIGTNAEWITITSGEPFLRNDIKKIINMIIETNNPHILCIATNGVLTTKIIKVIDEVMTTNKKRRVNIIINVSVDGTKEIHDKIRGTKAFDRTIKTIKELKILKKKYENLFIGINSVISKYNVSKTKELLKLIEKLNPDSFISEIAENREEFKIKADLKPKIKDYKKAKKLLFEFTGKKEYRPTNITKTVRLDYYEKTLRTLQEKKQIIPCFAGITSVYINQRGDVMACSTKGEILGNLKEKNYDLKKTLFNSKADEIKNRIKKKECYCTLANVHYTNLMCNLKEWPKIVKELI